MENNWDRMSITEEDVNNGKAPQGAATSAYHK